jgi:Initiator Replication protein
MGTKRISLEQLRKVFGLGSVKDTDGNIIQEAPLPVWANLRQRALDTAMTEITKKTDISIEIESLGRSLHRRVTSLTFVIKEQAVPHVIELMKSRSSTSARLPDFVEPMKATSVHWIICAMFFSEQEDFYSRLGGLFCV